MTASTAEWHDFFVAQAGASAALAGLMFVSLSINIDRILKSPWLPPRAASSMVLLVGSVIQALLMLWPSQTLRVTGAEELAVAIVVSAYATWLTLTGERTPKEYGGYAITVASLQLATLPAIGGSIAIAAFGLEGGIYAIACAMFLAIIVGVLNSWVLLVEILR
jgi:modulator of FtsH protease